MSGRISVVIPTYNYGRFLAAAVDSVLTQTYPNVEAVVVDNASTDGTRELVAERYANEPRVRYVRFEEHVAVIPSFNRALGQAHGEFVMWLSADDWFLPRHVERLHDVFERHPAIDVVYSTVYFADALGRVYGIRSAAESLPFDYVDLRDELPEMLTAVPAVCLPATLFRRALFEELGPMDERIETAADWELAVRFALAGKRFAYLHEPSACLRVHGDNASGAAFNATGKIVVETVDIIAKFLDHPGMARVRGREAAIALHLEHLRRAKIEELGRNPFDPAFEERLATVCATLRRRAAHYEPALVRSSRVSVIIPVIEHPATAMRAIGSVAAQTFPEVEIVVVDQGAAPLRELLRAHPAYERIRYARLLQRRLPGSARNFGLRIARGAYVAFLDEDNRFAPEHLEQLVGTVERTGARVVASGSRLIVELVDATFIEPGIVGVVEGLFRGPGDPPALAAVANALPLNAILQDRGALEHAGPFSETAYLLEDFDYLGRLLSVHQLAFAPAATLDVVVRLALHSQALGYYSDRYLPTLDAIYAAREVGPEIAVLRERHRAAVAAALAGLPENAYTPPGVVELLSALCGRNIVPAGSAGVVSSGG